MPVVGAHGGPDGQLPYAVGADEEPIAAAGEQLALELGAFNGAALDVDDLAVSVRRESDGLRFLQVHANLAQKLGLQLR